MTDATTSASPFYRAWVATALMVTLFALLFIPMLFLVPLFSTSTEGFADLAYVAVAMLVYAATVLVLVPAVAHTLGRYIDRRTRTWSEPKAAWLFAAVTAGIGSIVAVPLTLDGGMGVLPLLHYMAVPALAAFGARMLLPVALRVTALRVVAIVLAVAAAGVLAALAAWNLVQNVA
jgi:hypothetical protein